MDSEQASEQVQHGSLELAVITLDEGAAPALQQQCIWQDELQVAVAPDHLLATHPAVELAQLSEFTAIMPGLNTYTGQIIKALFEKHRLMLEISMSTNYLETIKMMVSIGLGWSVLPKTMLTGDTIKGLAISDIELQRRLGYIVHKERSLTNAAKAFIEILARKRLQD